MKLIEIVLPILSIAAVIDLTALIVYGFARAGRSIPRLADAICADDIEGVADRGGAAAENAASEYETISVDVDSDNFERLAEFMTRKLTEGGVPDALTDKMNVVLDELYSNVVKYSGSKDFRFGISACHGRISLIMQYGGELFDVTRTDDPDITLAAKDRPIGGLGLFIVKKIMDRISYHAENGKNLLILTKDYEETSDGSSR